MGKAARNSFSKQQKKKPSPPSSSSAKLNRRKDFDEEAFINQEVNASDQFFRDSAILAAGSSFSRLGLDDVKSGDISDAFEVGYVRDEGEIISKSDEHDNRDYSELYPKKHMDSGLGEMTRSGKLCLSEKETDVATEIDRHFEMIAESILSDSISEGIDSSDNHSSKLPSSKMVETLLCGSDALLQVGVGGSYGADARVHVEVGENGSDLRECSSVVQDTGTNILHNSHQLGLQCMGLQNLKVGQVVGSAWASSLGLSNEGNAMQGGPVSKISNQHYGQKTKQSKKILVRPSATVIAKGMESWNGSVIGHFLDNGLPLHLVKIWAEKLWGSETKIDIASLENGFFVFKFGNEDVRDLILKSGPHFFAGKWIIFRLWQPNMTLSKTDLEVVPIWVKFSKVPLVYWTKEGMECLSNEFGKFLHVDEASLNGDKLGFARVCVEISARKDIPLCMDVELPGGDIVEVKVEVPWKPSKCKNCNVFGHSFENCSQRRNLEMRKVIKKAWIPKIDVVEGEHIKEKDSDNHFPPLGKSIAWPINLIGEKSDVASSSIPSKDPNLDACIKERKNLLNSQKSFLDTIKASMGTKHHQPIMAARRNTVSSQSKNSSRNDPPDKGRK